MADVTVTINQGQTYQATIAQRETYQAIIGDGTPPHAPTHASGGSDSLAAYYYLASNPSGFITSGDFASQAFVTGVSGYLQGQIGSANNVVYLTGDQNISGVKNFYSRPTVNGTGVLLSGEATAANTGELTGVFYPRSNPSGYITGVDLSAYQTIAGTTGISGYLQGQISVLNGQTGSYALSSNTGAFLTTGAGDLRYYPLSSNPSSYLVAADVANLASTGYVTGVSGHLQNQITAINNQTGAFLTTGAGDGRYVLQTATGAYTGEFYPRFSNPSGYLVAADLSSYATTGYVTGASGHLQNQITSIGSANYVYVTGDQTVSGIKTFYSGVLIKPSGGTDTNNFVIRNIIDPSNSAANALVISSQDAGSRRLYLGESSKTFYAINLANVLSFESFPATIAPVTDFTIQMPFGGDLYLRHSPTNQSFILPLSVGEENSLPYDGYFSLLSNSKNLSSGHSLVIDTKYARTGGYLIEGRNLGVNEFSVDYTGNISGHGAMFNTRPTVNGTGVLLIGEINTGELTGVFYPLNTNPSGYITGVDLSAYATQAYVTGISGHLQGQISTLNSQSGQGYTGYNDAITGIDIAGTSTKTVTLYQRDGTTLSANFTDLQGTGVSADYYLTGASFLTGSLFLYVNNGSVVSTILDGRYALESNTGAFLTTGAGDNRYVQQSATGAYTGVFYPLNSNPSGYLVAANLSSYATQAYVTGVSGHLQSQINNTGAFLTTGAGDARYYPLSTNPSSYLVAADIASLASTGYVTGVSGHLQNQITAITNGTGTFVTTAQTGVFASQSYVNTASGHLQGQITTLNNTTGTLGSGAIGAFFDGGGSAITAGVKGYLRVPYNAAIKGWELVAKETGSMVVDVWRDTYANFPPVVGDSIAGTEKPTLSSAQKNNDFNLTTWSGTLNAGDWLVFNVDSATTITMAALSIQLAKI